MHTNLHQSRTAGTLSQSLLMLSVVTIAQPAPPRRGAPDRRRDVRPYRHRI